MAEVIYKGTGIGYGGEVCAELVMENGHISDVRFTGANETENIGGTALETIAQSLRDNGFGEVDAVSGATITVSGARDAWKKARIAAGLLELEEEPEEMQVVSTELLIVGCGVSGIAAALSASERGVQVLMTDRTEVFGGNGLWANGGFFVETEQQKAAGVKYTVKEAFEEAMYFANYLCDPILMRLVLGESAETVRWANSYGAGFFLLPYHKILAHNDRPLAYHCWDGKDPIGHFKAALESRDNVSFLYGVKVEELIQNEQGAIVGARGTHRSGRKVEIQAGAVYIGTGGYIANREMIRDAVGDEVCKVLIADSPEVSDGSGIQMAWKAGGGKCGEKLLGTHGGRTGLGHGMEGLPGCDMLMNLPILWVNRIGRRFMNEETIYESLFYSNSLLAQGGYAYIVFDRKSVEAWMEKTIPLKMHFWDRFGENGGYYCPPVKTFEEDFKVAETAGMGFCGATVAELAEKMGVPTDTLVTTVENYNRFVEQKVDTEFFKSAESLVFPVSDGPFYALQCNLQAQGTSGGIRVSDKMEVVSDALKPIPGLYAGGSDAGGLYAGSYTILAGMAISWALTSGRLAGRNAAEYLQAEKD